MEQASPLSNFWTRPAIIMLYFTLVYETFDDISVLTKCMSRLSCVINQVYKLLDISFGLSRFAFICSILKSISGTSSNAIKSTVYCQQKNGM